MTSDTFYHEFEANFRGTRAEIRERLEQAYAPFLTRIAQNFEEPKALDLGCGRGEWLELAQSFGIAAEGVDLDDGMLADCFALGLSVTKADAIAYLKACPSESLAVVSGFHIAEHLPFEALQSLIREALRALRPGGVLILETPNAENLSVGTLWFHMDPTHVRPLPPGFLSFLGRNAGFARVDVLRLQENSVLRQSGDVHLIDVFRGVSPDYAIVAQKQASAELMAQFDPVFGVTGGLTLETLSERFEQALERKVLGQVAQNQREFERRMGDLVEDYQRQLLDLRGSTSWKVTKPLRDLSELLKRAKRKGKGVARTLALGVLKQPALRQIAKTVLRRFPKIEALGRRLILGTAAGGAQQTALRQELAYQHISPRAKLVYDKLDRLKDNHHD